MNNLSVVFFFLLIIGGAHSGLGAEICTLGESSSSTLLDLQVLSERILKSAQLELAKQDPGQFCETNMRLRYLNVNPKDAESENFRCTEMSRNDLESYTDKVLRRELLLFNSQPWFLSLVPTTAAQQLSMLPNAGATEVAIKKRNQADSFPDRASTAYQQAIKQMSDTLSGSGTDTFVVLPAAASFDKKLRYRHDDIKETTLVQAKVCADLKVISTIDCTRALGRITEMARPGFADGSSVSFMPATAWKKVLASEKKYAPGLRRAARKLVLKLQNKEYGTSNIFDDLINSFKSSGMPHGEAEDATYQILALYGSGGANLGLRLSQLAGFGITGKSCTESVDNICGYLDLIGRTIPALDFFSANSGKALYSYPGSVEAKCNTNKSYHFWMAAYLSRQLVKEGFSASTAALASYAAGVGYQINRHKGVPTTNSVGLNALNRSTYDPVNNIIRADLAYVKAGADFGSGVTGNMPISIDKNLVKLLENSSDIVEPLAPSNISLWNQVQRYNQFKKIVVPGALVD